MRVVSFGAMPMSFGFQRTESKLSQTPHDVWRPQFGMAGADSGVITFESLDNLVHSSRDARAIIKRFQQYVGQQETVGPVEVFNAYREVISLAFRMQNSQVEMKASLADAFIQTNLGAFEQSCIQHLAASHDLQAPGLQEALTFLNQYGQSREAVDVIHTLHTRAVQGGDEELQSECQKAVHAICQRAEERRDKRVLERCLKFYNDIRREDLAAPVRETLYRLENETHPDVRR